MSLKSSLFTASTLPVPVGEVSCPIDISGYSLKNYQMFDPEGYTIMCETGKYCDILSFFPNTNTIVLEGNTLSHLHFCDYIVAFYIALAFFVKSKEE